MAMPRRRTNRLMVDGEPYHWRASRRAIMVEHADEPRGRVREFLYLQENIDEGRITHLVRHARALGWRPTEDDDVFEIEASSVWDDPRTRDHYQWMRLMTQQFHYFEQFLGSPIEVGAYWWHGNARTSLGGFGARLRFHAYDAMPEADLWEAAFCTTGTEGERAYTDVFAFPFRQGQNIGLEDKRIRTFWLKQDCERELGVWRDSGWKPWDQPEQWSHVTEPGRVFFALEPHERELTVAPGAAIPIRLSLTHPAPDINERVTCSLHRVREASRGDVIAVRTGDRWISWEERAVAELDRTAESRLVEVDIAQLGVPGGWEPGEYDVELRIRREREDTQGQSDICKPIHVVIA